MTAPVRDKSVTINYWIRPVKEAGPQFTKSLYFHSLIVSSDGTLPIDTTFPVFTITPAVGPYIWSLNDTTHLLIDSAAGIVQVKPGVSAVDNRIVVTVIVERVSSLCSNNCSDRATLEVLLVAGCPSALFSAVQTIGDTATVTWNVPRTLGGSVLTSNYVPGDSFGVGDSTVSYKSPTHDNVEVCSFSIEVQKVSALVSLNSSVPCRTTEL